ncbi:uncharacterized protein [Arachis hypogaea]|uniref:uncharacterized protein n=1 Tax=Arachis hypogaea TaxID=3818 RepID=UPI000DEC28F2|nr:uncharacterized protein LOC112721350 [Arachis hypogaea]
MAEHVSKCLTYQKVKIEHQRPSGTLQPLEIPQWKWESIAMDFVSSLPRTRASFDAVWSTSWNRYMLLAEFAYNNICHASIEMDPYKALYGRKCQSLLCWYEAGENSLLGPEMIAETIEQVKKIRDSMVTAQSRQKSYADQRWKPLEF